jgi:hypothetical protein
LAMGYLDYEMPQVHRCIQIIASFNKLIEDMPLNRALNWYIPVIAGALTKSKKSIAATATFTVNPRLPFRRLKEVYTTAMLVL